MNATSGRLAHTSTRLLLTAASLCVLLVGGTMSVAAVDYDPTRPTSNKQATSPGGGGGGGGGGTDRKVALGVAIPNGSDIQALDAFTASIGGNAPAIWAIWRSWGSVNPSFPMSVAYAVRERGATPFIWWEPVKPNDFSDPTYSRHQNITRGDHDAYIRQFARDAKTYGGKVLLRFAHEANSDYFPWSVSRFDNSNATFIAAWRHVHGIFQAEGATNVRFVWSVAKKACSGGCNPYTAMYPGDAYVDVMGFSAYNWAGAFGGEGWTSMYQSYQRVTRLLREISSKPIMAAETGSNPDGGDKAAWIRDGYREVYERLPDVEAIVYLHADLRDVGHPDWRLSSPLAALSAYAEIAALPQFSARWPFRARTIRKVAATQDREKRRKSAATKVRKTEPATEQKPRVRKGTAVDEATKPESKATRATNRTSGKRRKTDPEPPATLDTFSR
ncbi:hypothetical protein BH23CHL8_BH23CHL8_09960 [soil metagenome]